MIEEKEFEEKIIQIKRVSKKTKGGNRMSFTALVVVGDKRGKVGVGLGSAPSVREAIKKGIARARRSFIEVVMKETTIPHQVKVKYGAARVLLKPARPGTGVIAGGPIRAVVEVAGIRDIVAKILGTKNKITNVYATMKALGQLRKA